MNAAHLHLLVNHLPIVGFAIGLILLCATMIRSGDRGMFLASVLVLVIAGSGAFAAQFTGEPAEEVVENIQDVPKVLVETHEKVALVATILAGITSLLAIVLSVVTLRREGRINILPLSVLFLATLVTCGAMTWTGATGGKIRHSEVRGTFVTTPNPQD
jgi:uncharacterized membrane protein